MTTSKKTDYLLYLIGFVFVAYVLLKIIGYILPDRPTVLNEKDLLEQVIAAHGGESNWSQKKSIAFTKEFKLYREDARIEIDRIEKHAYTYSPTQERLIQWQQDGNNYLLAKKGQRIEQYINDRIDTLITKEQLQSKLNAAEFVIDLPHSLKTGAATLEYEGEKEFQNKPCYVLRAHFKDSRDIWWFYFDTKNLNWEGYWVKTSGHYSLVINEEMTEVDGFTLSRKRKSYRTDSLQNISYLRATYLYNAYTID